MKICYMLALLLLLVVTTAAKLGKKPSIKAGYLSVDNKPGQDMKEVIFRLKDKEIKRSKLKRKDIFKGDPKAAKLRIEKSHVYADEHLTTVCCKDVEETDWYCNLRSPNANYFFYNGSVLEMPVDPDATYDEDVNSSTGSKQRPYIRRRRSTFKNRFRRYIPDMTSAGIIRLVYATDDEFMKYFLHFNGDIFGAKSAAIRFLKVTTNEVTLLFSSIKDYNKTVTFGNTTYGLDIVFVMVGIIFPYVSAEKFLPVPWTVVNNGTLENPLDNFVAFVSNLKTSISYDHISYVTGYDLGENVIGLAKISSMCNNYDRSMGHHSSVIKLYDTFSRTVAHEIGHSLGSYHDRGWSGSECDYDKYIMSRYVKGLTKDNLDTVLKFSRCSAEDIAGYLNSITDNNLDPECLFNTGISSEQFLHYYCMDETRGSMLNLSHQCEVALGNGSTPCGGSSAAMLDANYVTSCKDYPLACTDVYGKFGSVDSCRYIFEVYPGTKCNPDGNPTGDKMCFIGECVPPFDMCAA